MRLLSNLDGLSTIGVPPVGQFSPFLAQEKKIGNKKKPRNKGPGSGICSRRPATFKKIPIGRIARRLPVMRPGRNNRIVLCDQEEENLSVPTVDSPIWGHGIG
jgi:hypothetical protein